MFLVVATVFSAVGAISAAHYPIFDDTEPPNTIPLADASLDSGYYNSDQSVKLSMSDDGAIYYTTDGKTPTTSSKKYTAPLSIKSTTILKFIAINTAGNKSAVYTRHYIIDKTAPYVILTAPKNQAQGVSLWRSVKIKFSEKVLKGPKYSKIYIKNLNTGKKVLITKKLSKNLLKITQIRSRLHHNTYLVYLPKGAFKDRLGNLSPKFSFRFKTQ